MSEIRNIASVLQSLKTDPFVLHAEMPMSYVTGLPILQILNDQLCLCVPFLQYRPTGQVDRTLVYPIRYTVTISVPEFKPLAFMDLAIDPRFGNVDFNKPVGTFRHDAIKHLNKKEYDAQRKALLQQYDKVIRALLLGEAYDEKDEETMCRLMQMLAEPGLYPIYRALDEDFYNKYLAGEV